MLGILKFKQSLFAGVLDGGEKEVFLGGSRLTKFMETVERASAAIPEPSYEDEAGALRPAAEMDGGPGAPVTDREPETEGERALAIAAAPAAADPWAGLLQNGLALLEQFTGARPASKERVAAQKVAGLSLVARDERTGETYLKLPMPKPEVLDKAIQAFGALLQSLRR
jgi:hypothetical protein